MNNRDYTLHELSQGKGFASPETFFGTLKSGAVVYGGGNAGKDIVRQLQARGIPVCAIIDRTAKPGDTYEGIPVLEPTKEAAAPFLDKPVIIGVFNYTADIVEIQDLLTAFGFKETYTFPQAFQYFAAEFGDRYYHCAHYSYYQAKLAEIERATEIWADEASKELFLNILRYRLTGDYRLLPKPASFMQYLSGDVPGLQKPTRFIDGGSFDGDTLRDLVEAGSKLEAVAAFEPEPNNYQKLVANVSKMKGGLPPSTSLFPCGLWSQAKQIGFSGGLTTGSHVKDSVEAGEFIQCVALDEALPLWAPDFIKMDIEGSEYDALVGATNLIAQNHPTLAISVYHRPQDHWDIPLLVSDWKLGYKLYLRSRAWATFDTVLYAIPG